MLIGLSQDLIFFKIDFKFILPAFSPPSSLFWAGNFFQKADPTRIELAIFRVTGERVNRYTTGPLLPILYQTIR